jgi:hypothetical protein
MVDVLAHLSCTRPLLGGSLSFSEKEPAGKLWVYGPLMVVLGKSKKKNLAYQLWFKGNQRTNERI